MDEMKIYRMVRKGILTNYATGNPIEHPWFMAGLNKDERVQMMNTIISQVFLVHDMYNKDDTVKLTWKRAIGLVKSVVYYQARKKMETQLHPSIDMRFDVINHLFRVQLGEEEPLFTYRLQKVSKYIVANYEGEEDLFKKFKKRGDDWYTYVCTTKVKYANPERTKWLKSGKQERFNIIDNLVGSTENEYLTDCMLLEHMVDCYKVFKKPYAEMMLALNGAEGAPYSKRSVYNYIKEFFYKAFILYGIKIKPEDYVRDINTAMDIYCSLDMLLKERKRGYSVADVLSK